MANIYFFQLIFLMGFVPASTIPENPRIISVYICKSSIFSFIEKTLGYSLAFSQVPYPIPL
jgi:hypothetical protein